MEKIIIKFAEQIFHFTIRDDVDLSIMREIFKFREYKSAEEKIKSAKVIVDVGAHTGFFTIYCRALSQSAKIFALEPEENNFKLLEEQIKENKLRNIKLLNCALAEKTGKGNLFIAKDNHNHKLLLETSDESEFYNKEVKTLNFSDFYLANKIKKIDFLKMDIEGGEYEVFENLSTNDFSVIKSLILEYHNDKKHNYSILEGILRENGFSVQVFPSRFDKNMGFIFASNKRLK